jgi:hypothetical protein
MVDTVLKVRRGYQLEIPTAWKNPDGSALVLTGWSAEVNIRTDFVENGGTTVIDPFTSSRGDISGSAVTMDDPAPGSILVHLAAETTALMEGGKKLFSRIDSA